MTIEPGMGVGGEGEGGGDRPASYMLVGLWLALIYAFGLQYAESHTGEDSG